MSPNIEEMISGEKARLLPIVADSNLENRALSIFMSVFSEVPKFSNSIVEFFGQRVGVNSKITCLTEVKLKKARDKERKRPDGLIILKSSSKTWTAFVEAKVANQEIYEEQILDYIQIAKENKIDAIITISNEFVADPTHHPLNLPNNKSRGIGLFHISWSSILTQAGILYQSGEITNSSQSYLIEEFIRYFSHTNSGLKYYDRMHTDWKKVVSDVQNGARLSKNDEEVKNAVSSWHQEQRDLCLKMSKILGCIISTRLPRKHINDANSHLKDDCDNFVKTFQLASTLKVPNAAAPIEIVADMKKRTIECSMALEAPDDYKKGLPRVKWLLRQLSNVKGDDIIIKINIIGKTHHITISLSELSGDPDLIFYENNYIPSSFEVIMRNDLGQKFSGTKTFIDKLEEMVPIFYREIGQSLYKYIPKPPQLEEKNFI